MKTTAIYFHPIPLPLPTTSYIKHPCNGKCKVYRFLLFSRGWAKGRIWESLDCSLEDRWWWWPIGVMSQSLLYTPSCYHTRHCSEPHAFTPKPKHYIQIKKDQDNASLVMSDGIIGVDKSDNLLEFETFQTYVETFPFCCLKHHPFGCKSMRRETRKCWQWSE